MPASSPSQNLAKKSGLGWRAACALMNRGSMVRKRHERQTARRRQSSLAGSRSRTSNSASGDSTPALEAAGVRLARLVGGERCLIVAIYEAWSRRRRAVDGRRPADRGVAGLAGRAGVPLSRLEEQHAVAW
uniref:Uncharacterized protein n=1 Tax=Arundo donax TaxID=35708 RepID=A0A0A9FLH5_ARUDO